MADEPSMRDVLARRGKVWLEDGPAKTKNLAMTERERVKQIQLVRHAFDLEALTYVQACVFEAILETMVEILPETKADGT